MKSKCSTCFAIILVPCGSAFKCLLVPRLNCLGIYLKSLGKASVLEISMSSLECRERYRHTRLGSEVHLSVTHCFPVNLPCAYINLKWKFWCLLGLWGGCHSKLHGFNEKLTIVTSLENARQRPWDLR